MDGRKRRRMVRRSRKARKNFLILLTVVLITGIGTIAMGAQTQKTEEVYYESVLIHSGDTLWDIADTYMGTAYDDREDYIDEVKAINHITEDALQAGSYIIVPSVMTVDQGNSLYR